MRALLTCISQATGLHLIISFLFEVFGRYTSFVTCLKKRERERTKLYIHTVYISNSYWESIRFSAILFTFYLPNFSHIKCNWPNLHLRVQIRIILHASLISPQIPFSHVCVCGKHPFVCFCFQ